MREKNSSFQIHDDNITVNDLGHLDMFSISIKNSNGSGRKIQQQKKTSFLVHLFTTRKKVGFFCFFFLFFKYQYSDGCSLPT